MKHRDTPLGALAILSLPQRLREVGLLLLDCDETGKLIARPSPGRDWLADLFCQAPIFIISLRQAAAEWAQQDAPTPIEASPGCWLAPSPRVVRRRRICYTVAVVVATPFLES